MQKKRNTYLFISLIAMVILSGSLLVYTAEDQRSVMDPGYFRVSETEKIDRVLLKSSTESIELKFDNNRWRVNDRWDADVQMVKVLFATLRQVEPRRPVAAKVRDSVAQWLEKNGTRVALFQGDQAMLTFVAGGNALKTEASFLKEGDVQPYLMVIPGYRVYAAGIFELGENGWRNRRIFDFNWRNFKGLSATYPKEPRQNFEVEMKDRSYGIRNLAAVDTAKLNNYLDAMSLLFARRYVMPGQKNIDSLISISPIARIEVKDIANRSYTLELFPPRMTDAEIFGRLSDGQIVALEKRAIGEIVKKRDYFVP